MTSPSWHRATDLGARCATSARRRSPSSPPALGLAVAVALVDGVSADTAVGGRARGRRRGGRRPAAAGTAALPRPPGQRRCSRSGSGCSRRSRCCGWRSTVVPGFDVDNVWSVLAVLVLTAIVMAIGRWVIGASNSDYVVSDLVRRARAAGPPRGRPRGRSPASRARRAARRPARRRRRAGAARGHRGRAGADVAALDRPRARHTLEDWWARIPSTTPASQAGLLHGDSSQIPAFRWWDRDLGRLVVTNHPEDAALVEQRLTTGKGLLAGGGTAVSTMFSGDAATAFVVMSRSRSQGARRAGSDPVPAYVRFFASPFVLARAVSALRRARCSRSSTRRTASGCATSSRGSPAPAGTCVLRGITNVLLRDLNTSLVAEALLRGAPTIYVDLVDYDEIAHHAGPTRPESLRSLEGLDRVLGTLERVAAVAPRDYRDRRALRPRPGARRHVRAARGRDAARLGARPHGASRPPTGVESDTRRGLGAAQRPGRTAPLNRVAAARRSSVPTRAVPKQRRRARADLPGRGHRRLRQPRPRLVPAGAAPADARGPGGALAGPGRRARRAARRRCRGGRHAGAAASSRSARAAWCCSSRPTSSRRARTRSCPYGPRGARRPAAGGPAAAHRRPAADLDRHGPAGTCTRSRARWARTAGSAAPRTTPSCCTRRGWAIVRRAARGRRRTRGSWWAPRRCTSSWSAGRDAARACGHDRCALRGGWATRARCSTSTASGCSPTRCCCGTPGCCAAAAPRRACPTGRAPTRCSCPTCTTTTPSWGRCGCSDDVPGAQRAGQRAVAARHGVHRRGPGSRTSSGGTCPASGRAGAAGPGRPRAPADAAPAQRDARLRGRDAVADRVWFAGDTAPFAAMADLPALAGGPIDLALVPVGGWGPRLSGGHMDAGRRPRAPARASVRARPCPVHWGTLHAPVSRRLPPGWMDRAGPRVRARRGAGVAPGRAGPRGEPGRSRSS